MNNEEPSRFYLSLKNERCLRFKLYNLRVQDINRLCEILDQNNFEYVHYFDGLYELFKIRKNPNKTWNQTMEIVNQVQSAKYSYENTCIVGKQEYCLC